MIKLLRDLHDKKVLLSKFNEQLLRAGIKKTYISIITKELELTKRIIRQISKTLSEKFINQYTNRRFRRVISGYENFLNIYDSPEDYILIQDLCYEEYYNMAIFSSDFVYLTKNNKYSVLRPKEKFNYRNGFMFFVEKWNKEIERCNA